MAELNVTSVPWIDSGDAPPLALDRDKRDIISQGIADPLVDYDIVPLTYTNSRWSAFFYRVDEAALRRILPKCLELEDDVVEFWYVDHLHTGLGPYGEMGVTVSASCKGHDGNTYYAGYYPYMYLTQDAAVFAGREPFGFPKKIAYIVTQEHGGKEDDGYGGFGNDYFNFTMERRGYLIHTATGRYDDAELPAKPSFYGDPSYGRMNLRLITDPSLTTTKWDLTYLPSEVTKATAAAMGRPETEGQHRFQLKPESIRTASAGAIRSWALTATPFDNLGAMMPVKELIGLMSFNFDLIIPGADTIWTQTIERTAEDIGDLLFADAVPVHDASPLPEAPGRLSPASESTARLPAGSFGARPVVFLDRSPVPARSPPRAPASSGAPVRAAPTRGSCRRRSRTAASASSGSSHRSISISSTLLVRTPSRRRAWIMSARRSSSGWRTRIARFDRRQVGAPAAAGRRCARARAAAAAAPAAAGRGAAGAGRRRGGLRRGRLRGPARARAARLAARRRGGAAVWRLARSMRRRIRSIPLPAQPQATSTDSATARNSAAAARTRAPGLGWVTSAARRRRRRIQRCSETGGATAMRPSARAARRSTKRRGGTGGTIVGTSSSR